MAEKSYYVTRYGAPFRIEIGTFGNYHAIVYGASRQDLLEVRNLSEIETFLKEHMGQSGYVLFDRLLAVGENSNRFRECFFDGNAFQVIGMDAKAVTPERDLLEKINRHYLGRESELEDSVLTLEQKYRFLTGKELPEKNPVMKVWTRGLSWKEQTVLLSALRGCDSVGKNDLSKKIVRRVRRAVLNNAGRPGCEFMQGNITEKELYQFSKNIDAYPVHFLLHLIHASEVIGYLHPEEMEREFFHGFYQRMVKAFHMNPETEEEMRERLKDGVNTDCHKT